MDAQEQLEKRQIELEKEYQKKLICKSGHRHETVMGVSMCNDGGHVTQSGCGNRDHHHVTTDGVLICLKGRK